MQQLSKREQSVFNCPQCAPSSTVASAIIKCVDFTTSASHAEGSTQLPSARPRLPLSLSKSRLVPSSAPLDLHVPCTPINVTLLEEELVKHHDSSFVNSLCQGLRYGFHIGYTGPRTSFIANNLVSSSTHPDVVASHLAAECDSGHTAGPYSMPPCTPFRSAGIGVVPKKSGGHRIIVHLSAPAGSAINEGIDPETYSLQYITVGDVVRHVKQHGVGALMYKVDIRHAFRNIPVHPDDWCLLGMVWDSQYYIDKVLPFGLRSSPAIFNQLADALCWLLRTNYGLTTLEHYLDDFTGVAPPSSTIATSTAAVQKATLLTVFDNLGVPVATGADKNVGPTTSMTVLGIEVDSVAQVTRLSEEKFHALLTVLKTWSQRVVCTKRELLSLIGSLSFAAKVVPPGRTFIRRLIDLSCTTTSLDSTITLDDDAQLDIHWWLEFAGTWNGRCLFHDLHWT